jgi:hypothetical protein
LIYPEALGKVLFEGVEHLVHKALDCRHQSVCIRNGVATFAVRKLPPMTHPSGYSVREWQYKPARANPRAAGSCLRRLHVQVES